MNQRQKAGIGMAIGGIVSLGVGIVIGTTVSTPVWVDLVVKVLSTVLPLLGLVVNLPTNTNPK